MSFTENEGATPPIDPPVRSEDSGFRYLPVRFTMTGEPKAIRVAIYLLSRLNFIENSAWSRPIAVKAAKEVIVVAERSVLVD